MSKRIKLCPNPLTHEEAFTLEMLNFHPIIIHVASFLRAPEIINLGSTCKAIKRSLSISTPLPRCLEEEVLLTHEEEYNWVCFIPKTVHAKVNYIKINAEWVRARDQSLLGSVFVIEHHSGDVFQCVNPTFDKKRCVSECVIDLTEFHRKPVCLSFPMKSKDHSYNLWYCIKSHKNPVLSSPTYILSLKVQYFILQSDTNPFCLANNFLVNSKSFRPCDKKFHQHGISRHTITTLLECTRQLLLSQSKIPPLTLRLYHRYGLSENDINLPMIELIEKLWHEWMCVDDDCGPDIENCSINSSG
jgi:hypothetical protein